MKSILITSSILIVLIAALRPILRGRINPRVQYALWLIAALRLLAPVELAPSAYSALALLERAEEPARVVEAIGQTAIPAQSYDSAHAQIIEQYRKQGVDTAQLSPRDLMDIDTQARELTRGPTLAELASKYAKPVWLGGTAVMALWFLLVNARLRRKLSRAELIEVEESCGLPVFVSGALPSPCLCGVLRPAVFVTPAAAEDPDRMRHVLAHETTHYRHRDHWWALVRCLCLCLYWFNPLVWWAAAMSRQDCELACDAGAIRRLGEEERLPYGRTLVAMIAAGRNPLLQTATTMTGGRRRVRERVQLIARKPKTVIALALALALVLGLTVGFTFTGAPEKPMDSEASTLDTLQERLLDVPEELKPSVKASASETKGPINNIALASYWWDVPAEWESEQSSWLLSVHQWERSAITPHSSPEPVDGNMEELIAMNEEYYFTIEQFPDARLKADDEAAFFAVYQAIRAYAVEQVLATEGVEPYSQPLDTLQSRLLDVPEELQADVAALQGSEPTATLNRDFTALAQYWMNRPWADYNDIGMGWLLTVYQWDQEQFEQYYPDLEVTGGVDCFARDDNFYYIIFRATDGRAPMSETKYAESFDAIWAYAVEQVLSTDGVEPYTPGEPSDTQQQRLMALPEEWRDKISASPAMGGEVSCLASYALNDPKWRDLQGGWLLDLYRMDEAGIQEKLDQGLWPTVDIFARIGEEYYALIWLSDGRYQDGSALSDEYWTALNAMKDHVKATVLATEGTEPFDPYTTPPHFFSNVPLPPLEPGSYAIDGMDYTLVTSYEQVPEDPEQWYLVGQMSGYPVWMFTRNHGQETMFQVEDQLTQVFPYTARYFGGGQTHDGRAPQFMPLEGFGWGPKGTFGPFAVITHVFQGGTDQMYHLTVYNLDTDPVTSYVHDMEPLMDDFNQSCTFEVHPDRRAVSLSYGGQTAEITFHEGDALWDSILEYGFSAAVWDTCYSYSFNDDGTANLIMPIDGPMVYSACWTLRFTGSGFETVGFQFVETSF